jgi:hypothetical protein
LISLLERPAEQAAFLNPFCIINKKQSLDGGCVLISSRQEKNGSAVIFMLAALPMSNSFVNKHK